MKEFRNQYDIAGSGEYVLKEELKNFKKDLKNWNKNNCRDINKKKRRNCSENKRFRFKR